MTINDKNTIVEYISGSLSKEEFLRKFSIDLIGNKQFIINNLLLSFENKDVEILDYNIPLIVFDKSFSNSEKYVDILNKLLAQKWHYRHEDLVALLQGIKSPKSIDILYETALTNFDYLNYDDSYSLAIKCIYALKSINTPGAKEKLKLLALSDNPIVKEQAEKQLVNK